jgi:hypothetical protein
LLGSRRGPTDRGCNEGQHRICCEWARDRRDRVIVTEKLDGSNVGAARIDGEIVAITRSGYVANTSPYEQHHMWGEWVAKNRARFLALLEDGERACGEWLALAHGTRYALPHEPLVVFDIRRGHNRATWDDVVDRCSAQGFTLPHLLHDGCSLSVADAMAALGPHGHHGATDEAEGAVWRVERTNRHGVAAVDFLAKYVRAGKVDGRYLAELNGGDAVWNWRDLDAYYDDTPQKWAVLGPLL